MLRRHVEATSQLGRVDSLVVQPLLDVLTRGNGVVGKGRHVSSSQ